VLGSSDMAKKPKEEKLKKEGFMGGYLIMLKEVEK
jgi:hypothetical protein